MNRNISTKNTLAPLRFCVLAVLLFIATSASAYDFYDSESGLYYNILSSSEKTVEVTYGGARYSATDSYVGDVVIPETVSYGSTSYSVVSIGNFAFYYCTGLTSVVIPDSVSEIGTQAFEGCASLTSVDFGNGVTTIEYAAFYNCTSLTGELKIPDSVTTIGMDAFLGCKGLTSLTIGSGVTTIESWAFYGCSGLTSIVIPDGVTTIGERAFAYCYSLTEITIPNSVIEIGNYAFYWGYKVTSLSLGNSVTSIGDSAFYYCSGLKSVYSYNFDPPSCGDTVFHFYDNVSTNTCALYVPTGSKDKYSTADQWKDFYVIYDGLDGIESVSVDGAEVIGYYTIDGKAVDAPQKGVNIVKYSDGSTKKVLVK